MQTIVNLGTGGADLNGQNGSTASADSNDARFLDWPGDNAGNYVYLSGVAGNSFEVADEAALDITDDIDLQAHMSLDDYVSGATQNVIAKSGATASSANYIFFISSTGTLNLRIGNGSTSYTATSTDAIPTSDGVAVWLRAVRERTAGTVKFYTSDDGESWSQLGSTITSFFAGAANTNSDELRVGQFKTLWPTAGAFYRVRVFDGVGGSGGTLVLDIDTSVLTSGSATSFTAVTGQTVTINRSTSGRKSVAVVSPVWLFGTDDYMEVSDNALLDVGASDDFTVLAAHRVWNTQGTDDTLIAKKANTTNTTQGWSISAGSSTALEGQAHIGDGSAGVTAVSDARVVGALTVTTAVRDVAADTLTVYRNGTAGSAVTDTTTASLSNGEVLRIARLSGAGTEYSHMELFGVAVFRHALTADEIASISSYYANKVA